MFQPVISREERVNCKAIAKSIVDGTLKDSVLEGFHGKKIEDELIALGFKPVNGVSCYLNERFYNSLKRNATKVTLRQANFIGSVTDIEVSVALD